ncbi:hypothetical protein EVAR_53909_1 [Eumeta japonica]|uniref:Uncharacterized protein n=1 Tax=Eumeta variegata TaxID=151549 RepID=A0A4C1YN70_EUMVA|nr:hypothetical protein EVAR_53909_1 [Eumeta japonica]
MGKNRMKIIPRTQYKRYLSNPTVNLNHPEIYANKQKNHHNQSSRLGGVQRCVTLNPSSAYTKCRQSGLGDTVCRRVSLAKSRCLHAVIDLPRNFRPSAGQNCVRRVPEHSARYAASSTSLTIAVWPSF